MYFYDHEGQLKSLAASWTSLKVEDPFVAASGGRALFRPRDLLKLADLLESLRRQTSREAGSGEERV